MVELLEFTCGACGAVNRLKVERILQMTGSPKCGGCRQPLLRALDASLKDMSPEAYQHPLDREALSALEKVPGVKTLLKSLIENTNELQGRLSFSSSCLRVGPKQVPSLYERFRLAAERLGVDPLPELYIYQSDAPNAFTGGVEKYHVCISTGALDLLTDEEQLGVLAHELGHVKSNHVLYKSAARALASAATTLSASAMGAGGLIIYPLRMALNRWDRASELTADRAQMLVVKRPEVVLSTLMKLAGGSRTIMPELSITAFIEQAEQFEKMRDVNAWSKVNVVLQEMNRSHPFPVYRAREALDFVTSGAFLEILDGDYPRVMRDAVETCTRCSKAFPKGTLVCPHCGNGGEDELRGERVDDKGAPVGDNGTLGDKLDRGFEDARGWFKKMFGGDKGPDDPTAGGPPPA